MKKALSVLAALSMVLSSGCMVSRRLHVSNPSPVILLDVTADGKQVVSSFPMGYVRSDTVSSDMSRMEVSAESYVWRRGARAVIDTVRIVFFVEEDSDVRVRLDKEGRIDIGQIERRR